MTVDDAPATGGLEAVFEALPAAVVLSREADGVVLHMNPAAEALFRRRASEHVGRSLRELDTWIDGAQMAEALAILQTDEQLDDFPARLRRGDGTTMDCLVSARTTTVDGERCLVSITLDVSEHTQAEGALRRSEHRLRQVTETIDQGFVLVSFRPLRVHYASPAFATLMGTTLEEAYGRDPDLFDAIDPDDRPVVKASLERMRSGQRTDQIEVRVVRGQEMRWVRIRWSKVDDAATSGVAGDVVGDVLAAVVEDVTDRRRSDTEAARARARAEEANQAKSTFLSRVSHELRTPLNVILGFGQILELDQLAPDQQDAVREIMDAGRHLLHLVDQVLDISRAEAGQLPAADARIALAPVVEAVIAGMATEAFRRGVEIRHQGGCTHHVRGDADLLRDALGEIVENAVVHNDVAGTVEVSCEPRPGGRVRIAVEDTGPGLTAEALDRAFLPFSRGQQDTGTGLGLTRARRQIEAMGGEVGARSVPGRGSRFWIDLEGAAAVDELDGDEPTVGHTVLYIEDNESNAELARRALAPVVDIDLLVVGRGADGLARLARGGIDLLLLDLHLPDIGGEEILERVRSDAASASIPVVVVSADASPDVIARVMAAGADDYLTKPVSVAHLVRVVTSLVTGRRQVPARTAPELPSTSPVVDADVLADLQVLEEVEPGTLREVVEVFARAGADRIASMEVRAAERDRGGLADLAHALRGSGANLGAVTLAHECQVLERLSRSGELVDAVVQIGRVRRAFDHAVVQLRRHVGGGPTDEPEPT